jgi:hypothetical protein
VPPGKSSAHWYVLAAVLGALVVVLLGCAVVGLGAGWLGYQRLRQEPSTTAGAEPPRNAWASAPLPPEPRPGTPATSQADRLKALREGRFVWPPRNAAPATFLRGVSERGDFIGQGQTFTLRGDQIKLVPTDRGVSVTFEGFGLSLGAPVGRSLTVGQYLDAKRHPFSDDRPGIEFTGHGRGCNEEAGRFVVWELEVKGNQIVRLAADFVVHCEVRNPPFYGLVRYNSTLD